jgi:hypothetical protein
MLSKFFGRWFFWNIIQENYKFYNSSSFQMSKFLRFIFKGCEYVKKPQKRKKGNKKGKDVNRMNVYNINGFFWRSICIPEAYRGYALPFIPNVSVKIVYIYFYMLSCEGFLQMEVSIFQLPHLLWSHNSVLAYWMGHANHKIVFSVYFSMYSFVRFKNALLVQFFPK